MSMNRRHFLTGLAGILASGVAPAVLPAGSIMRVKPVLLPGIDFHLDLGNVFLTPEQLTREALLVLENCLLTSYVCPPGS
jgi:hypothetical protein